MGGIGSGRYPAGSGKHGRKPAADEGGAGLTEAQALALFAGVVDPVIKRLLVMSAIGRIDVTKAKLGIYGREVDARINREAELVKREKALHRAVDTIKQARQPAGRQLRDVGPPDDDLGDGGE